MAGGKKVLVTGASGFIGSELCKALVARGDQVTALVRSERSLPFAGAQCLVQDLETRFEENFLEAGFDAVIHLAGKAHGKGGPGDQSLEAFERSNVSPTRRLAEAAVAAGIKRFVYLSSIGIHGDSTHGAPINEESPERPHADYARSKLQGEGVVRESLAGTSTAFSIIRPTLVYGESAPGNFGKLVGICNGFLPLPLGCANNRRSLVSLESLVNLIVLCIDRPEAKDQVFVAADATSVSTREMVCSLRSGMGRSPGLIPLPRVLLRWPLEALGRASVYRQLFGDLEVDAMKAADLLGWERETETLGALRMIGRKAVRC